MSALVKEITETEIAESSEIIRQSFKTVADEFNLTKEKVPTNGAFLEDSRLLEEYSSGIKMFGIFEGESQIGFIALEQKDHEMFYLEKLSILPEYRHKGYGKALVDFAVEYVKSLGGKIISIGIIYENIRLMEWYKKLGFIETGTKVFSHLPFTVCFLDLVCDGK